MNRALRIAAVGWAAVAMCGGSATAQEVPPGFELLELSSSDPNEPVFLPTSIAFTPDGSAMFVAEKRGVVRRFVKDAEQSTFVINLIDEVGDVADRGMLSVALDPNFDVNHYMYLLYTVDPTFGQPDEDGFVPSFGRLTRYTLAPSGDDWVASLPSRLVLIGTTQSDGVPICEDSHTIGCLAFGPDGMLLVSTGDGASYFFADAGGQQRGCTTGSQDIGAFRSQNLDSLAGKILRIDPATGNGLSSNPFWTGNATARRSKVWVSGMRNPFKMCVKPGSTGQGTVYVGDVGWADYEEVSVATGGENMGWPCREGFVPAPSYPFMAPSTWGCNSMGTGANPGPVTGPLMTWHHTNANNSDPAHILGSTTTGLAFYTGTSYPPAYQGALFYVDYTAHWIRAARVTAADQIVQTWHFGDGFVGPVAIMPSPSSGDLYIATINPPSKLFRLSYTGPGPGDVDGDFVVDINDYTEVVLHWGNCPGGPIECPSDFDGNGVVDIDDFTMVILNWTL